MTLAIGTEKGAYLLDQPTGDLRGPLFPGWKVTAWATAPDGTTLAAVASNWFGASIHRSADLETWEQVPKGPAHPEGRTLEQIWTLHPAGDRVYAGVAEAGLFVAGPDGRSWEPVDALNEWPTRDSWVGGLGGLAAHHVLTAGDRIWIAISAAGVFRSDDGGASFRRVDAGVDPTVDAGASGSPNPAYCVHGLAQDPADPDRIWRQEHIGVFRSTDGGDHWERAEDGLPGRFGFPMIRDHASGRLFVVPLAADANRVPVDGAFAAYRSDDDGDHWSRAGVGWPGEATFTTVLRNAWAADGAGMIALGTTSGRVWITSDGGDTWTAIPQTVPRILALGRVGA